MESEVKTETMKTCLSCPLCHSLLRDATTISECLHTFCRKCIYEKITEDEIESCPVCNIDLGGAPLEKLRPDHILQDLRAKIFPLKRKKVKAPGIVSLTKRKERSMSSLVISTPKVSPQAGTKGRRTKVGTRKEFRGNGSLARRNVKKEESSEDEVLKSTSSPEKSTQGKRQIKKSYGEADKENKDGDEPWDWKPLNFLLEVANGTKPSKSSASQGSDSKTEHANASHSRYQASKTKTKDPVSRYKRKSEKSSNGDPTTSEIVTPMAKRLRRAKCKRPTSISDDSGGSPQPDESGAKQERRNGPVWFSLVASNDQYGQTSLPQIPSNFLRIRDRNIPVSSIQKYLMRKLELESETEIEIRCMGEALIPTLKLDKLVDIWLKTDSKHQQQFSASVGASAKDYMMVLVYARKLLDSNN